MASVEVLRAHTLSLTGEAILKAVADAARLAGDEVREVSAYQGASDWLVLFGVGASANDLARKAQIARGGRVLHWDLGYFDRKKVEGHARMSIDSDHPQDWLDRTAADARRWAARGIELRSDSDPSGPIVLVGLGRKSRAYLGAERWEQETHARLRTRFPGRRIIFRPKGRDPVRLKCEADSTTSIADLLRGASLVVCRHSNVAVDAAIAGVPFEAEDGAAVWLQRREFTPANRLAFLQRLAYWQWRTDEAAEAWAFAKRMTKT